MFLIESESSGRSISPPSSFASGSEAETGEFPRIEEIIPISSIDEYEYTTSRKGARCSSSSAAKSSKYYPTSSTTSLLPRDSQQPVRIHIFNSIQKILWNCLLKNILFQCYHQKHNFVIFDFFQDSRGRSRDRFTSGSSNKDSWRFAIKRKINAPVFDTEEGATGSATLTPPPKYTPPEKASQEVASTSIFHAASPEQPSPSASRSPKEPYSKCDLQTLHHQQDENKYKNISIKVPRGIRKNLVVILHPMFKKLSI